MKTSVITLQNVFNNYGSVLQAFATYEKLKEFSHDVEIIDYWRNDMHIKGFIKKNMPYKFIIKLPSIIRWKTMFSSFKKQYLNITEKCYISENDFRKFPIHDGCYCTGSDQVWNNMWESDIAPLFLSFVPEDKRKFSFAASFGRSALDSADVERFKKYIDQYDFISVREDTGLAILKEQFGCNNAIQVVDPTLAMPPEFWRKYASKSKIKHKYILIYCIHRIKGFNDYARKLSQKTGLPLVRLCQQYHSFTCGGKNIFIPSIFDYISLIDNANIVLTDSFHATAFSMQLNIEPICVYPPGNIGRITSLLRLVGAEHRVAKDFDDFDILNRPTDFDHVNQILTKERERVEEFLIGIFNYEVQQ